VRRQALASGGALHLRDARFLGKQGCNEGLNRMRSGFTMLLLLLALAAAGAGLAEKMALFSARIPPQGFFVAAGVLLLLVAVRVLPLAIRRPVVFLLTTVVMVGLAGGLYYMQFVFKPQFLKGVLAQAFAPKPTGVAAEAVRREEWPPQLQAIGTVRAFQGITISPQVAGVVKGIHFESGEAVKEGALLVSIDDSVEQADLANGLAQLKNADLTLARQKTLVAGNNTPQSSVDSAIAARDSAQATVSRTRAVIAQKALKAPFSGRLGLRSVDLGQFVPVGQSLTTLQQIDPIYVDFPLPEEALATLGVGQPVSVIADAYPQRRFEGKITAVDARVSADSRNVMVRAQFENAENALLPGMFANVVVTTGKPQSELTLPRTAIVYSLYGDNVFVVKPAAAPAAPGSANAAPASPPADVKPALAVERRFVKLGPTRGERVAILSGLAEGDIVVTAGQVKLQQGSPVYIEEGAALPPPAETKKP
jgi:RND family efflux transporter MFP subunit